MKLKRLEMAIDLKQKKVLLSETDCASRSSDGDWSSSIYIHVKSFGTFALWHFQFVSHPNIQQLLASLWYEGKIDAMSTVDFCAYSNLIIFQAFRDFVVRQPASEHCSSPKWPCSFPTTASCICSCPTARQRTSSGSPSWSSSYTHRLTCSFCVSESIYIIEFCYFLTSKCVICRSRVTCEKNNVSHIFFLHFSLPSFSHSNPGESTCWSASRAAVRHGKDESDTARSNETSTWQSAHASRAARRDLCARLYLGRDARDFRRGNSQLLAEHVEFYWLFAQLALLSRHVDALRRVHPADDANQSRSSNSFHSTRALGRLWSATNCKIC